MMEIALKSWERQLTDTAESAADRIIPTDGQASPLITVKF